MLMLVLTARWLGPEGRGVAVVVTTWVTLSAQLLYLSLGQICVHRAASESDQRWIGPVLWALLIIAALATILGWAIAAAAWALTGGRVFGAVPAPALLLGFAALPFFIWEQYSSALLSILGRLKVYNVNQLIGRTFGILMLVVTIRGLGMGLYGFLVAFVLTQLVVAGGGIGLLMRHLRGQVRGGISAIGGLVRDGAKIHINAIGVMLYSGMDILMLNHFRGPAETAIFQFAMQLFLALLLVPQSAVLALQGHVALRSIDKFWWDHRMVMVLVVGVMSLIATLLWLVAPWLVPLLATNKFAGSIGVFRLLLVALPLASFSTLMAIQWIARGYFWRASLITLGMGAMSLVLNLILMPRLGATGGALSMVASYLGVSLIANGSLAIHAHRDAVAQRVHR